MYQKFFILGMFLSFPLHGDPMEELKISPEINITRSSVQGMGVLDKNIYKAKELGVSLKILQAENTFPH
jgi:hypothetical protein